MPTAEQRTIVEGMCAYGIPHEEIARLIINPETKSHISSTTLRQHFREEIDTGLTKANTKVIGAMFKNATVGNKTYPNGIPVIQIFWAKARMGWQGSVEDPGTGAPPGGPVDPTSLNPIEVVRRIANMMLDLERTRKAITINQPKAA